MIEINKKDVKRWWNRFKRCINDMPDGIELIIDGEYSASIYESGTLFDRHLGSEHDGGGISWIDSIHSSRFKKPIFPYGEGQ